MLNLLYENIYGTWGAVSMTSFHTCEGALEGIGVLAGDGTGRAASVVPPLA